MDLQELNNEDLRVMVVVALELVQVLREYRLRVVVKVKRKE